MDGAIYVRECHAEGEEQPMQLAFVLHEGGCRGRAYAVQGVDVLYDEHYPIRIVFYDRISAKTYSLVKSTGPEIAILGVAILDISLLS